MSETNRKQPNFKYLASDDLDDDKFELFCPHTGPGDLEWIAEAAADDYHSNHDGWEAHWPRTFIIFDMDDNRLGQCEVDREAVPQFRAYGVQLGS